MTREQLDRPDAIIIERTFEAPVELVWKVWTEPESFAAWYGPDGATIRSAEMDVRVGGRRLICMEVQTPRGPMQMWFTGQYREVVVNERLVYTDSMSNADGEILDPSEFGMPPDHPSTTEVRVELDAQGPRTTMVLTHVGVHPDSPGATGWTMALDKLVTHLDRAR